MLLLHFERRLTACKPVLQRNPAQTARDIGDG